MKSSAVKFIDTALRKTNRIKCFGNSMAPILLHEDVVYYRKILFSHININDIVIAKDKSNYITHRVIFKGKNYIITKGDNNFKIDPLIYSKNIIGRVYQVKRNDQFIHPDTMYLLQSTQYFEAINDCISELNKHNIPYVLLKGLILHLYYSKTHPRRQYTDFDILVKLNDYQVIDQILTRLGYTIKDDSISSLQKRMLDKSIEVTYVRKRASFFPIAIDVHFEPVFMMTQIGTLDALYEQKNIDELGDLFLNNQQVVTLHNSPYQILSPVHLVVYLALHFFHHNYRGIHRLDLLNAVIKNISRHKKRAVWKEAADLILKYQLENYAYGSYVILQKYFKTPIPKTFLKEIAPSKKIIRYINQHFKKNDVFETEPRSAEGTQLFQNLFYLSPKPLMTRLLVFLKPIVIYMIVWAIYSKMRRRFLIFYRRYRS